MPDLTSILKILKQAGAILSSKPSKDDATNKGHIVNIGGTVNQTINQLVIKVDKPIIIDTKTQKKFLKVLEKKTYLFSTPKLSEKESLITQNNPYDIKLLGFIQESLPNNDHSLWKAGLLLRHHFKKGNNELVVQIKNDMIQADQIRGKNIANLCTAGYLETEIIPMHSALTDLERSENFTKFYEALVTQTPTSVFVGIIHNEKSLREELSIKIEYAKKYSAPYVKVHALGKHNVGLAIKILKEVREKSGIEDVYYPPSPSHLDATIALKIKLTK